jgi:hypothetical protein
MPDVTPGPVDALAAAMTDHARQAPSFAAAARNVLAYALGHIEGCMTTVPDPEFRQAVAVTLAARDKALAALQTQPWKA